jgi:hypothetical protein
MTFAARTHGGGSMISDTRTLNVGMGTVTGFTVASGYSDNTSGFIGFDAAFGSITTGTGKNLTGGKTWVDGYTTAGPYTYISISGFTSDPGAAWLSSIVVGGTTYSVSYNSYGSGVAIWYVNAFAGFLSGSYSVTLNHG